MDVGLSNGVNKSGLEGVVDHWGVRIGDVWGGVGQSIPGFSVELMVNTMNSRTSSVFHDKVYSQLVLFVFSPSSSAIGKSVDEGGDGSGVLGGAGQGHRGEGKESLEDYQNTCQYISYISARATVARVNRALRNII